MSRRDGSAPRAGTCPCCGRGVLVPHNLDLTAPDVWSCSRCGRCVAVCAPDHLDGIPVPASNRAAPNTVVALGPRLTFLAHTRRRGGRPKLTKAERVAAANLRRAKNAERMRLERATVRQANRGTS
jgi:hypothetical protein